MHGVDVHVLRLALVLDVPHQVLHALRRLVGRAVAHRVDADLDLVLPGIVDDLQAVLARLVDRQRRLAVELALLEHRAGPLIAVVCVAVDEPVVVARTLARDRLPVQRRVQPFLGLADDVVLAIAHSLRPIATAMVFHSARTTFPVLVVSEPTTVISPERETGT